MADVREVNARTHGNDLFHDVEPEDLIKFGLIPEFVGRLPVVATLDELDEAALMSDPDRAARTRSPSSIASCSRWKASELEFRDDALRAVARRAMQRKTGARGLRTILENVLLDTMYELPSMRNVAKVVVDEDGHRRRDANPYLVYRSDEARLAAVEERRRPTVGPIDRPVEPGTRS